MDAIKIPFILSVMILFAFTSCKSQAKYNDAASVNQVKNLQIKAKVLTDILKLRLIT